jgi:hypothetical protein
VIGGLAIACFPLDPRFKGSNPAKDNGFLRAIKICSMIPSEEKKTVGPLLSDFYGMLKNAMNMKEILSRQNSAATSSSSFSCFSTTCLCW